VLQAKPRKSTDSRVNSRPLGAEASVRTGEGPGGGSSSLGSNARFSSPVAGISPLFRVTGRRTLCPHNGIYLPSVKRRDHHAGGRSSAGAQLMFGAAADHSIGVRGGESASQYDAAGE